MPRIRPVPRGQIGPAPYHIEARTNPIADADGGKRCRGGKPFAGMPQKRKTRITVTSNDRAVTFGRQRHGGNAEKYPPERVGRSDVDMEGAGIAERTSAGSFPRGFAGFDAVRKGGGKRAGRDEQASGHGERHDPSPADFFRHARAHSAADGSGAGKRPLPAAADDVDCALVMGGDQLGRGFGVAGNDGVFQRLVLGQIVARGLEVMDRDPAVAPCL